MAGRPKRVFGGRYATPMYKPGRPEYSAPHVDEKQKTGVSNLTAIEPQAAVAASSASQLLTSLTLQSQPSTVVPGAPQTQSVPANAVSHEAIQIQQDNEEQPRDIEMEDKKPWSKKLLGGVRKKTSTKEKRMRQNNRLRKVLMPKNALMALHEIQGIKMSNFTINMVPEGFSALVTANNIQYEGQGPSKICAKNDVCEKVLRDLFLSKMMHNAQKSNQNSNVSANGIKQENTDEDVQMKNAEDDDEDVPLINLASYALYKLFAEWEQEGFDVPEFRNNNSPTTEKPKKSPTVRLELPPNWETYHPTTLLCLMRPSITYVDLGFDGTPPNQTQKMGVTVDGESFIGYGRSKKMARRDAACMACNKVFGTNFTKEVETVAVHAQNM